MSFMRRRNVILQNICMRWDFPGVRQGTRGVDSSFTSRQDNMPLDVKICIRCPDACRRKNVLRERRLLRQH
jgi:hypothetical protein